jgi:hypothetical protein
VPIPKPRKPGSLEAAQASVLVLGTAVRVHLCRAISSAQFNRECRLLGIIRQPWRGDLPIGEWAGFAVAPSSFAEMELADEN